MGSKDGICLTDKEVLRLYVQFVPFLAQVCGPGSEVVVHDATAPEHSLIAISNNVSGREVGNPMTDLSRELAARSAHTDSDYLLNYTGKSKDREFLSSTYYIKNEGRLIGLLCVNKDMSAVRELNSALLRLTEQFNLTVPQESEFSENLENPMTNMMQSQIADAIAQSGVSPARMSLQEKVRTVHRLNESGVMMMKGAMAEIASQLGVSVPTVYRYLNKPLES